MTEDPKNRVELPTAEPSKSWEMIRTLAGLSVISGILIVGAFQITLSAIQQNKARMLGKAVLKVIPHAVRFEGYQIHSDGSVSSLADADQKGERFYVGYDSSDQEVGVAIEAQGQGFQDVIRFIYGYSPEEERIIGFQILESKETPGLGSRIEEDPDFLSNFQGLDVRLSKDRQRLEHSIEIVKKGDKKYPWQIDTITGATISSKAVGKIIRRSTEQNIPGIFRNLEKIKKGDSDAR